jgi:predicted alpha/beta superfamily hydrolase
MRVTGWKWALALALTAATGATAGIADSPAPHPITIEGAYYDLTSTADGQAHRIYVRVPHSPAPKDGFPVIYVLDGNWYFPAMAETETLQAATGELPAAVIVGIGYPPTDIPITTLRSRDLSLPVDPATLPERFRANPIGGGDRFLAFVDQQVKPLVEKLAPIDRRCQTLWGHSFGGLLALHAMFTAPDSFHSFVAASPSVWWGQRAVLKDEAAFAAKIREGQRSRLLVTVGQLEQPASGPTAGSMVDNARQLTARLGALPPDRMEVQFRLSGEDGHNGSALSALNRGLHFGLDCKKPVS